MTVFVTTAMLVIIFSMTLLFTMLPQGSQMTQIDSYRDIEKEEYTFQKTKDISNEALARQYNITGEDIQKFKEENQYRFGNNIDPFYNEP